ncbi:MAG: hypothetical protein HY420_02515 [Candidatus Kerfeldbacteria bacterium]|nr:hypothetical protein [Candidatus Kerfeldbacteria bacterium]
MARPRKNRTGASPRTQAVPVRVVKSGPRPSRPAALGKPALAGKPPMRASRPEGDRRLLMWSGVAIVTIFIFIAWLTFLPATWSRGSGSDSLLARLRVQLTEFFKKIQPFRPTANPTNAGNSEIDELRNNIFPPLGDQHFSTTPTTTNLNVSQTTNGNISAP